MANGWSYTLKCGHQMGLSNNQSVLGKHGLIKGAILLENRARSKQGEITKDQIPSAINISNPGTTSIHIIDKITDFPPSLISPHLC